MELDLPHSGCRSIGRVASDSRTTQDPEVAPGGLVAEIRRNRFTDVRAIYPTIHVPTLVLATTGGDPLSFAEDGRYLASVIPRARLVQHDFVERPWLHWYRRAPAILSEVERFVDELGAEEQALKRMLATVVFTDIVESSAKATALGDARWRETIERHHALARAIIGQYDGREIDTAGDGFFAAFDGPGRAIRAVQAIATAVGSLGIEIRAGIHTGECEVVDGKPAGVAVNIGARIASLAVPGEVLVSRTVRDLVAGSGIDFDTRGEHELKGVPGEWQLYAVTGANTAR
jgi:class 3 adenylate cyclase